MKNPTEYPTNYGRIIGFAESEWVYEKLPTPGHMVYKLIIASLFVVSAFLPIFLEFPHIPSLFPFIVPVFSALHIFSEWFLDNISL